MTNDFDKKFLCEYFHDGSWWSIVIFARDLEDAKSRVEKLGKVKLLGEIYAELSEGRGNAVVVRLVTWCRNAFSSLRRLAGV